MQNYIKHPNIIKKCSRLKLTETVSHVHHLQTQPLSIRIPWKNEKE